MEEINLKELGAYYLSHITFALIVIAVILIMGCIYSVVIKKPLYHGTTSIVLANPNTSSTITSSDIQVNKNLVETYSQIIKSRKILSNVVNQLHLSYSETALASKVSVSAISDTEIIRISVSDRNNQLAAQIANKIAEVFMKEIMDIYSIQNVTVIDEAIAESTPYNINIAKEVVLYLLIGIILSAIILFVLFYFDTTIKSSTEIEEKLGLTVLGNVPIVEGRNNL